MDSIGVVGAVLRVEETTSVRITATTRTTTGPGVTSHIASYCLTVSQLVKGVKNYERDDDENYNYLGQRHTLAFFLIHTLTL
jgi:hypothetical protein